MMPTDDRRQRLEALLARVRRNRVKRQAELFGMEEIEDDLAPPEELASPDGAPDALSLPVTGAELELEGNFDDVEMEGTGLELESDGIDEEVADRSIELLEADVMELHEEVALAADEEDRAHEEDRTTKPTVQPAAADGSADEEDDLEIEITGAGEDEEEDEEAALIELTMDDELEAEEEAEEEPPAAAAPEERAEPEPEESAEDTIEIEEPHELIPGLEELAAEPVSQPEPEPEPAPAEKAAPPAPPTPEPTPDFDDDDDEPEIEISYGTDEAIALSEELGFGGDELDDDLVDTHEDLQLHPADRPTPASMTPGMDGADMDVKDTFVSPTAPSAAEDLPASTLPDLPPEDLPEAPELPPLGDLPASTLPDLPPADLPEAPEPPPLEDLPLPPLEDLPAAHPEELPAQPATASPTLTSPERFEARRPERGAAVAEVVSDHEPPRAKTLGALLDAALRVGRKS